MRKFLDDLRALDLNDVGRWPLSMRIFFISLIFVIVTVGATYYFVIKTQKPILEAAQAEESELRAIFESRQRKAVNFDAYKVQLAEIEESFGAMLRQLPGKTEVPNLLVDVSQIGLAAGLNEDLFRPEGEIRKGFYAELPIKIRLSGSYHELARFVSDVAALPRIVTLHDIDISESRDESTNGDLAMQLTAKTYRYLEEDGGSDDQGAEGS
jgi:type IV pilus assembly protein PilO